MAIDQSTVEQYYTGVLRLEPTDAQVANYMTFANADVLLTSLQNTAVTQVNPIIRVYQAAFDRVPDSGGLTFYVENYVNGGGSGSLTLDQIATNFSNSPEFQDKYGDLSDTAYVGALYANILGRSGEQAGIDYWVAKLEGGMTRAQVLLGFSESPEFKQSTVSAIETFQEKSALGTETYTGSLIDNDTYTLTVNTDIASANQFVAPLALRLAATTALTRCKMKMS